LLEKHKIHSLKWPFGKHKFRAPWKNKQNSWSLLKRLENSFKSRGSRQGAHLLPLIFLYWL